MKSLPLTFQCACLTCEKRSNVSARRAFKRSTSSSRDESAMLMRVEKVRRVCVAMEDLPGVGRSILAPSTRVGESFARAGGGVLAGAGNEEVNRESDHAHRSD